MSFKEYIGTNKNGQVEIEFNNEIVMTLKHHNIFAYSLDNGHLTLAVRNSFGCAYEKCNTIIYTIDLKSKNIIKEERLNSDNVYRDSNLEFSIIGGASDTSSAIMRYYTRKGEIHKIHNVALPIRKEAALMSTYYISRDNYIIFRANYNDLYAFSIEKKKFTYLGKVDCNMSSQYSSKLYIPLNEYVIYFISFAFANTNVFLYNYAENALYVTRYQNTSEKAKDTIEANIKNGNAYEQFLPLHRIENIDSMTIDQALRDSISSLLYSNIDRALILKDDAALLEDLIFLGDKLRKRWVIARKNADSISYFLDILRKQKGNRDRSALDSLLFLFHKLE